jgi:hypothetical protein
MIHISYCIVYQILQISRKKKEFSRLNFKIKRKKKCLFKNEKSSNYVFQFVFFFAFFPYTIYLCIAVTTIERPSFVLISVGNSTPVKRRKIVLAKSVINQVYYGKFDVGKGGGKQHNSSFRAVFICLIKYILKK